MKFFFDRNISRHIARMLSHFDRENDICHQDDDVRFSDNDEDTHLITTVKNDHPKTVWVTADLNQRKSSFERAALRDSGMCVVFFRKGFHNREFHYQAMKALAVWPTVVDLCRTARTPSAFEIPLGPVALGKVDKLGPTHNL